MGRVSIERAT